MCFFVFHYYNKAKVLIPFELVFKTGIFRKLAQTYYVSNQNSYTVYSASAGSGKTFTLVKEYLQILLQHSDVNHFKSVLAITFTNKAAAEMKERVLANLQAFARGQESEMLQPIHIETGLDVLVIQKKSQRIIEAILWDYTAFNITTIDSFTHRIIRSFAYDFGLSLNFDVEMDSKKLLQEAVDAVIEKIGLDKSLTKALISFSHQKSADDKTWDISKVLFQFATVLLNETDKIELKSIADKSFDDFVALQKQLKKQLSALKAKIKEIGEEGVQLIARSDLHDNDFYRSMLPNHFNKLAENWELAKFFDQSKLRERIEENTLYSKSVPIATKARIENILPQLLELYLQSERLFGTISLSKLFSESLIPLAVLSYVHNAMEKLKEDNNVRLINEFNELIFKKIQNEPTPFIYERLGEKFQHFFIDEMQDTSVLQWKNLIKLIENSLHQEGGSLLLVGDAKQAIYRWRGGASEQFIELANETKKGPFFVDKNLAHLDTNYRSFTEIIQFNNSFFQHIANLLGSEVYANLYKQENSQKYNTKKGGFVQIELVETKLASESAKESKEDIYPKKVWETICGLDTKYEWKDVCVLVRKHAQGVQIANYLNRQGIDIISSESLLLASDANVDFLISLLYIIQHPKDETSRYKVLDYLYGFLRISNDKHEFFSKLIKLEEADFYTSLKVYGIGFLAGRFHQKSLYDGMEYAIRSFQLTQKSNAYLQFFLDEILDFQIKYGSDLSGFLEHWEQQKDKLSISSPEAKNAVQIMTIHKAKGLQFPIVIFPYDLDIYFQMNPKIWYPITEPEMYQGFDKMLLPFRKNLQYTDEIGTHLYNQRREMMELDNYNLLYVCLTRAEEQLYVLTDNKVNKNQHENTNYFSGLFINYLKSIGDWNSEQLVYTFGENKRVGSKKDKKMAIESVEATEFISTDLSEHQVVLYTSSSLLWDTEQGKAISYGNLVHEILAEIKTADDIDESLQLFLNQGIINETEIGLLKKRIAAVVEHPELNDYFQHNAKVYNEREIVNSEGISIIPDRVVVFPDKKAIVIDYKTGLEEKTHQRQVEKYADYLSEMGYEVVKKLLVYITDEIKVVSF